MFVLGVHSHAFPPLPKIPPGHAMLEGSLSSFTIKLLEKWLESIVFISLLFISGSTHCCLASVLCPAWNLSRHKHVPFTAPWIIFWSFCIVAPISVIRLASLSNLGSSRGLDQEALSGRRLAWLCGFPARIDHEEPYVLMNAFWSTENGCHPVWNPWEIEIVHLRLLPV